MREAVKNRAMLAQNGYRASVSFVEDAANFLVDHFPNLFGVISLLADIAAQENHLLFASEGNRTESLAHPELGDHTPDDLGCTLDVVPRTGAHFAEYNRFRRVASE